MPPNAPNPLKRPRQDPVSCQFCRSKKLKCNRQNPCSNCSARGLPCDGRFTSAAHAPEPNVDASELSVLARLKRLEEIVIGKAASVSSSTDGLFSTTATEV